MSSAADRRRVLVLANHMASRFSAELAGRVTAILADQAPTTLAFTDRPEDSAALASEAAGDGYAAVAVLGGDGAINWAINGLAGSETSLACLPAGCTNVFARTLGVPNDAVEAAELLAARLAADSPTLAIDLGSVNGRYFGFGSGVGLSADIIRRVEPTRAANGRLRQHSFVPAALSEARAYMRKPRTIRAEVDGEPTWGVSAVVQNSAPFTYFGRRPVELCPAAGLMTGALSMVVLRQVSPLALLTIPPLFVAGGSALRLHPGLRRLAPVQTAAITAADGAPLPVEVDGEYVGEFETVRYAASPTALRVVPGDGLLAAGYPQRTSSGRSLTVPNARSMARI